MEYILISTKDLKNYSQEDPDIANIDQIVVNLNNVTKIETYTCTDELHKGKKGIVLYSLDNYKYFVVEDMIIETNSSIINSLRDKKIPL